MHYTPAATAHLADPQAEDLLASADAALLRGERIQPALQQLRALERGREDIPLLARIALLEGRAAAQQGKTRRALQRWLDAQALAQECGEAGLIAESWLYIGNSHREQGDASTALRLHEHALSLLASGGHARMQAMCLLALAADLVMLEAPQAARLAIHRAEHFLPALPASCLTAWHEQLAALHLALGSLAAAVSELRAALPGQERPARLASLVRLGDLALRQQQYPEALALLREAAELAGQGDSPLHQELNSLLLDALEHNHCHAEALALLQGMLASQPPRSGLRRTGRLAALELKLQLLTSELELNQLRVEAEAERQKLQLLETSAYRDALTQLPNRNYLNERLPEMLEMAATGLPLSLLLIDIDGFKAINERFDRELGDRVLVQLAGFLEASYSDTTLLARAGGEEFALVLPGVSSDIALRLAEQIRQRIAGGDWQTLQAGLSVTVSIGHAAYQAGDTMDILLLRADLALFLAKREGGNRVADGEADPA